MIVIPGNHGHGDSMVRHWLKAFCKYLLLRWRGIRCTVGVTAKQEQVDLFSQSALHHEFEGSPKIIQPRVETGGGINTSECISPEVDIRRMEYFHSNTCNRITRPRAAGSQWTVHPELAP